MDEPRLSDRDERWDRVAHDGQLGPAIKTLGQAGQFEGQGGDLGPRYKSRQCAIRENRHRERFVATVAGPQSRDPATFRDVVFGPREHRPASLVDLCQVNGGCAQHRGRQVRVTLVGVAPSSIRILVSLQVVHALRDQSLVRFIEYCAGSLLGLLDE